MSLTQSALAFYKSLDDRLGIPSSNQPSNTTFWTAGAVYAAGAAVICGGFIYTANGAGTAGTTPPTPNNLSDGTITWTLKGPASSFCVVDPPGAQSVELGYIADVRDYSVNDYGMGEMIYVKFSAAAVNPGDFVIVNRQAKTAVQTPAASPGASQLSEIGICMGTVPSAGGFGWVMIRGVHDAANLIASPTLGNLLAGVNTAGRATTVQTSNYIFDGSVCRVASTAAGSGTVELYWPLCSGR